MQKLDVAVLGGAAVDWVAQVEALPRVDSIVVARSYARFAGGSAANVAVGLSRLGYRTGFVGKLGDDEYGQWLLQAFAADGVDTRALIVERGRVTASCFIAVDKCGERIIVALPGATIIEGVRELDIPYLHRSRALYIGPAYPEVAGAAMIAAHEGGGTVFYAPSGAWGPGGLADIAPIVQEADVLLVSQAEATALTGLQSPVRAVERLHAVGSRAPHRPPRGDTEYLTRNRVPVVIETLGRRGAMVLVEDRITEVRGFSVAEVRDTTGAGDAFAAGLIAGFLEGQDWVQAARMGCAVAALKIRHLGARSGLPEREDVQRLLTESEE